ncbi:MAG: hypothetical protein ABJA67_02235 [Chthonomonadales bacterium]
MLSPTHISNAGDAITAVMMLTACLIFGSLPCIRMIGWWSEGTIDGGMAMIAIMMYIGLLVSATMLPIIYGIVIILVILSSAIMFPIFSQVNDTAQLRSIDKDRLEKYSEALDRNPMDHAARLAYAEALKKEGDIHEALKHMEWLLETVPSLSFRVRPQVESWRRELERVGVPNPIICHRCHAENAWNAEGCEQCGAAFGTVRGMKQSVHNDGGPKAVIRGWLVASTSVIVVMFVLFSMPTIIAGPIILATVLVAIWLFLKWVGGDMGTVGD